MLFREIKENLICRRTFCRFVDTFVGRNALQRRSTQEGWPIGGPLVPGEREPVLVERAEETQAEVN